MRALYVPDRSVLALKGSGAFHLLQRLTTKNVARLLPSTPQYTMFLTEQVRVAGAREHGVERGPRDQRRRGVITGPGGWCA